MPLYLGHVETHQTVNRTVHYAKAEDASHPELAAFYAVWNAARGARPMPERADIDIRSLRKHLRRMQLYDIVDNGQDFRFRVSGSDVFVANGIDMTGKLLSDHPNAGVRERLSHVLQQVTLTGQPIHARFESLEAFPVQNKTVESVYLPLGGGRRPTQIVGLTVFRRDQIRP